MIETPLKRGAECYWKRGDAYSKAYFLSLNQMPIAPHAVKIKHRGMEQIAKDCEVFTLESKFEEIHALEIHFIRNHEVKRGFKKRMSKELNMSYSTVLNIFKKSKELGIDLYAKETKAA